MSDVIIKELILLLIKYRKYCINEEVLTFCTKTYFHFQIKVLLYTQTQLDHSSVSETLLHIQSKVSQIELYIRPSVFETTLHMHASVSESDLQIQARSTPYFIHPTVSVIELHIHTNVPETVSVASRSHKERIL